MAIKTYKTAKKGVVTVILVLAATAAAAFAQQDPAAQTEPVVHPQALQRVGIYDLQAAEPNLTGTGSAVAVISRSLTYHRGQPQNDFQPDIAHQSLSGDNFTFYHDPEPVVGVSAHTTAICSILFGSDDQAFHPELGTFNFSGVVPQADAQVHELWHFLRHNIFTQRPPEADVIAASMGTGFQDWWTRGFDALAQSSGIPIVAGIGNGSSMHDPPLYPAAGANVIAVGVVNSVDSPDLADRLRHFTLPAPQYSTIGPTADGRVKPDIVAPGNCLAADPNQPWLYMPTGSYSSYSTPIVAGTIAMLTQTARANDELSPLIESPYRNCLTKAILLNSAQKLPFWNKGYLSDEDDYLWPLDFAQGAGMLDAAQAHRQLVAGQQKPGQADETGWDIDRLNRQSNPENVYQLVIDQPADKTITITLNWNKNYAQSYPFEALTHKDADLALQLWAIDPYNHENDYLLDFSDSIHDNLEHIYVQADPDFFHYEIVVTYNPSDVTVDDQHYGLAWNVGPSDARDDIGWYDLNGDGRVDNLDLAVLINNWVASRSDETKYLIGDISRDGKIDIEDTQLLISQFGRVAQWYQGPEPTEESH